MECTEWEDCTSVTKRVMEGGEEGSRWWGPGEHFIFLIDNNSFINGRSFHMVHTVHHRLEFSGRTRKHTGKKRRNKKTQLWKRNKKNGEKSRKRNRVYQSWCYCQTLWFLIFHHLRAKIPCSSFGHSCILTYFLTEQIVCHRVLVHSCTQAIPWQRNKWLCCSLQTNERPKQLSYTSSGKALV